MDEARARAFAVDPRVRRAVEDEIRELLERGDAAALSALRRYHLFLKVFAPDHFAQGEAVYMAITSSL